MNELIDLVGQRFGRLTVIERAENNNGTAQWLCKCDCGNTKIVRGTYLRNGNTRSCGCLQQENRQRSRLKDLTGQKFGKLTVIERAENDNKGNIQWLCQCECGNKKVVRGYQLTSNKTKSCGCLVGHNSGVHYKTRTRLFNIWASMKQRCSDKNSNNYKNYGAKGVKVCDKWQNNFISFSNWAKANGYNDKLTIDRINNDGNYEPNNCRWVDMKTQQRNKSNNHLVTINGNTKCLAEWCIIYHISPSAVWLRTQKGVDIVTAITTPSRTRSKRYDG